MRSGVTIWVAGAVALASAFGVIAARHQVRVHTTELQALHAERDALNVEWERLLLEQGTSSDPRRVATLAQERLGMVMPSGANVAVVRIHGGAL